MKVFDKLGRVLGWIATRTSVQRTREQDALRLERHGGRPRELFSKTEETVSRLAKNHLGKEILERK